MEECQYCSTEITKIYHTGKCDKIKAIEYHESGKIKRVEFFAPNDYYMPFTIPTDSNPMEQFRTIC